jgi:predicted thioesterase
MADGDQRPTVDPEGSVPGTRPGEYERRGDGAALEPGVERTSEFEVSDRLLTDVGGTIGTSVLSTPGMIAMIERNAAILCFEGLPEGQATVGFEVCVKHVAPAAEGARCIAHARLHEIVDGRKLRFDVEVKEGERTIGVGTHERRVIAVAQPGEAGE